MPDQLKIRNSDKGVKTSKLAHNFAYHESCLCSVWWQSQLQRCVVWSFRQSIHS